jgi:transposase
MAGHSPDPKLIALRELGVLHPHPERVSDPLFVEHAFFDPRDLVQVKYEMLRLARLEAHPVRVVAARFGFSHVSYYQLRKALETSGLVGLLPKKRGPRGGHKLTPEVLDFVEAQIRRTDLSLDPLELVELVEMHFGVDVHPRSLERALARREKKP